jgi:hypothetical protein
VLIAENNGTVNGLEIERSSWCRVTDNANNENA